MTNQGFQARIEFRGAKILAHTWSSDGSLTVTARGQVSLGDYERPSR